jgi:hypothetical protein
MKNLKLFTLFTLISITLLGCIATVVPIDKSFYSNQKKTGIIYSIDSIGVFREGAQGILDIAITPGNKYSKALLEVDKHINPMERIKEFYSDLLTSKGKTFTEINFNIKNKNLPKFDKPSSTKKKYYKYDFRDLKKKGIDEVIIVQVKYGIVVSYYAMIETGRAGYSNISTSIVDLHDNSLLYKNSNVSKHEITGKWKLPPYYKKLKKTIQMAITESIEKEKENINK